MLVADYLVRRVEIDGNTGDGRGRKRAFLPGTSAVGTVFMYGRGYGLGQLAFARARVARVVGDVGASPGRALASLMR